ncbi:MAG: RNA polymerase sigma-70 factor [Chloroflexota bacterium]
MNNETFPQYQPYLFSIAYRMLGSVMDAEDMVQEAWLRWQKSNQTQVESPKSFLASVVTRLCIDHLRSAKVRRESYIGPWLPEPLLSEPESNDGEAIMMLADNVSYAFLQLLERMTPTERAVYLLRHVFEYEYKEISLIVEKSEAACRQIFRRARQHLTADQPRFDMNWEAQQLLLGQFWQACLENDVQSLQSILAEDVIFYSDGGGKAKAARRPVQSKSKVLSFLLGLIRLAPADFQARPAIINGQMGAVGEVNGRIFNIFVFYMRNGRIQNIYSVLNPDKLKHIKLE